MLEEYHLLFKNWIWLEKIGIWLYVDIEKLAFPIEKMGFDWKR